MAKEAKCKQLEKVVISNDEEKFFQAGVQLPLREKEELIDFLKKNIDVFAWSTYKAPMVDPDFICHHLNVNPSVLLKKQPPRHSSKEHSDAIKEEVLKLKWAGAIKELCLPKMVGQHSDGEEEKWEMKGVSSLHGFK